MEEVSGNIELEVKKTDQEIVNEFLSNKENKIVSAEIAQQIKEIGIYGKQNKDCSGTSGRSKANR